MLESSFEELVKAKAIRQASESLRDHAKALGFISDEEWRVFKIASWDAMIFDMAQALNLKRNTFASHEYRMKIIQKWLTEGL